MIWTPTNFHEIETDLLDLIRYHPSAPDIYELASPEKTYDSAAVDLSGKWRYSVDVGSGAIEIRLGLSEDAEAAMAGRGVEARS